MKVFKLLKTALLIFFILGLSRLEGELSPVLTYLPFILYGLCFLLVLGTAFWLVKIKKVKLFLIPIFALMLSTSPAFADDPLEITESEIVFKDLASASKAGQDVCASVGRNDEFDLRVLAKARGVLEFFNKYGDSGNTGGVFSGENSGITCSRDYIDNANAILKAQKTTCSPTSAILRNLAMKNKCWPCDVTSTIIAAIQKIAINSYDLINNGAKLLLGCIYLMWLAITILISFAKFGFEKFAEFFTKIINQTLIVIVIALILHAPLVQFYKATISPFITYSAALGMRFSDIAQKQMGERDGIFQKIIDTLGLAASSKCHYCNDMQNDVNKEVSTGQFIDSASINGILCVTCSTYRQTAPMISLGQVMICLGRSTPQSLGQLPIFSRISQFSGPNISLTMTGYFIVVAFSIFTFLVGYFIMASVFKLGVVFVLMPLFLVAFAFKASRSYAAKAWQLIIFSMGTILIVSMLATMMTIGFSILLPDSSIASFTQLFFSNNASMITDMLGGSNLVDKLQNATGVEDIAKSLIGNAVDDYTFLHIITMSSFTLIAISVLSGASELAEQITNSWQLNTRDTTHLSQSLISAQASAAKAGKAALGGAGLLAGKALNVMQTDEDGKKIGGTRYSAEDILKGANEANELSKKGGDKESQERNRNNPNAQAPGPFDRAGNPDLTSKEQKRENQRWDKRV